MAKAWSIIKLNLHKNQRGFSPIELLLAATIFGMLVTVLVGTIIFGRNSTANSGDRTRAVHVAEEGVEAIRNIRDGAGFAGLANGTYGLAQSGGVWTLSGSSDTVGVYSRSVTISTVDTKRKEVTSTVTWPQASGNGSTSVVARLTNWVGSIKSWLNAIESGSYNALGSQDGLKVATQGDYAYVVRNGGTPNFLVMNVHTPATPTLVGSFSLTDPPTNVFVSGNYAYVTTSSNTWELQIMDISNPAAPYLAGTFNAAGNANGLAVYVVGNYAYMSRAANGGSSEFVIINISNPIIPTLVGSYGNNITMNDVVVNGSYAYVGTNSNTQEILVLDIGHPATPTLASSLNLSGNDDVFSLARFGTTLFAGRNAVLESIKISDPLTPAAISSVPTTDAKPALDIDVDTSGAYVFIGTNAASSEFQVASVSNPASMSIVRTVDLSPGTNDLNGVAYNSSLDIVVGASKSDTKEVVIFIPN